MKINITKTLLFVIIGALLVLFYFGFSYHNNKVSELKTTVENKDNLTKALVDSVDHYKDENGRLVYEKRTLQADISELSDKNIKLSESQKKLMNHVKELNKENDVLNSAYIETKTELNELKDNLGEVDTLNKRVTFKDSTEFVEYELLVNNVLPYKNKKPRLSFDKFTINTDYNVDFVWGDKKEGYPVSVKLTYDNPFVQTKNVESYIIPNVKPDVVEPSGWNKVKKWFKNKSNFLIGVGVGFGAGAIIAN
ncbi:MAG: hypothetical protein ACOC2U_00640 [bacterium]